MSPQLESLERAIAEVQRAGEEYANLAAHESALQDGRHGVKQEAIKRLMEPTPLRERRVEDIRKPAKSWNPQANERRIFDKGHTGPPLASSPSAAEKMVHQDEAYAAHLMAEREVTLDKNLAYTRLLVARLRALGTLVDAINTSADPIKQLLTHEVDMDLIRNADDAREEMPGGVPR